MPLERAHRHVEEGTRAARLEMNAHGRPEQGRTDDQRLRPSPADDRAWKATRLQGVIVRVHLEVFGAEIDDERQGAGGQHALARRRRRIRLGDPEEIHELIEGRPRHERGVVITDPARGGIRPARLPCHGHPLHARMMRICRSLVDHRERSEPTPERRTHDGCNAGTTAA